MDATYRDDMQAYDRIVTIGSFPEGHGWFVSLQPFETKAGGFGVFTGPQETAR
jgi:hypothetical protein